MGKIGATMEEMTSEEKKLDDAWRELQASRGMYDATGWYSSLIRLEQAEERYEKLASKVLQLA